MRKLAAWFTDTRRQALHAALGTLAAFAVAAGWLNDDQSQALIGLTGSFLVLAQGVVSLSLLRASDAARWFGTVGRGVVFGFAASAGAAGVVFGILDNATVEHWLAMASIGLTSLSSFLAVVNVQTVDAERLMTRREYRASLEEGSDV